MSAHHYLRMTTNILFHSNPPQEYGQPPRELMAELAPNMFFSEGADAAAAGGLPKDLEGCPVQ
jgi:hypothetical protein